MPLSVLNEFIKSQESKNLSTSRNEPSSIPNGSQRHRKQSVSGSEHHPSSDDDHSRATAAAAIEEDKDSDSEVLSVNWVPTPTQKISHKNDELPADTPSKSPSRPLRRDTPPRQMTEQGSDKILPDTPKLPENHVTPSQLKSSAAQEKYQSSPVLESSPINTAPPSNVRPDVRSNSVEELPSSTAELAPKRNKVRRPRRSMPWASKEDSSPDPAKRRSVNSKTLASVTQEMIRSSPGPRTQPLAPKLTLAQVTQGHLSSPAAPVMTREQLSAEQPDVLIQPDVLTTHLIEPQSSLPLPLEAPQKLPNDVGFNP